MKNKNVTVVYNRVTSVVERAEKELRADDDNIIVAQQTSEALKKKGYNVSMYEVDRGNLADLGLDSEQIYFNLAEGVGNEPKSDYVVARQLEEVGATFTGCSSHTLFFTNDKVAAKELFIAHSLPTPRFQVFEEGVHDFSLKFPLFVKPSREDSSLGITEDSIVTNLAALKERIAFLKSTYDDPVLVEEYVEGRELNVTIIGEGDNAKILPISEVMFGDYFKGKYNIVDFAAKWEEDTEAYKQSWGVAPAELDKNTQKLVELVAMTAYNLTDCRDYARVDLRLSPSGEPYVLEVNANPGLAQDSGAVRSAKASGLEYNDFIASILEMAAKRYAKNSSSSHSRPTL